MALENTDQMLESVGTLRALSARFFVPEKRKSPAPLKWDGAFYWTDR